MLPGRYVTCRHLWQYLCEFGNSHWDNFTKVKLNFFLILFKDLKIIISIKPYFSSETKYRSVSVLIWGQLGENSNDLERKFVTLTPQKEGKWKEKKTELQVKGKY